MSYSPTHGYGWLRFFTARPHSAQLTAPDQSVADGSTTFPLKLPPGYTAGYRCLNPTLSVLITPTLILIPKLTSLASFHV